MAVSKQRKDEILESYKAWLDKSRAIIVTEYKGLAVKDLDTLRQKMRDNGGEFHIVKNTLGKKLLQDAGYSVDENMFTGSTAIGFAFEDAPGLAKALSDYANTSEFVNIKGGYLANNLMNASQVKALADLPPLPVVRAQLLGMLNAPASKLVRTLAEPGRQIAAVIKAFADKDSVPAEA
ncbi:MAG: 50S ribosomal protein L10 [Anaerolineales bacterium]|nr:50S ribosomal protein L10 [Anaerolineales bacterium]